MPQWNKTSHLLGWQLFYTMENTKYWQEYVEIGKACPLIVEM